MTFRLHKNLKVLAAAATVASSLVLGQVMPADAALTARSPEVDPTSGFPLWYQDSTGMKLALGNNPADPMQLADPVVAGNAFSAQTGFGAEAFYWNSGAIIDLASGGQAQVVMGLEAAYFNGAPAQGDQMAFSRIRIRVDAPVAGSYTVTHPYGSKTFNVAVAGPNAINDTIDIGTVAIGLLPTAYDLALAGDVGPFLTAVNPPAPAGYIGNPGITQTVTGSPTGNNFFRVQGPAGSNLGGIGVNTVQTDQFTLSGKIVPVPVVTVNTQTATTATPVITGTVNDTTATVSIVVNGQAPVSATVKPDGTWSAAVATALANGTYDIAATITSANGTANDTTANELTVNIAGAPVDPVIPPVTPPTAPTNTTPVVTAPAGPVAITDKGFATIQKGGGMFIINTNVNSTAKVFFGVNRRSLKANVTDGITGMHHEINFTTLRPRKIYYFKVVVQGDDGSQSQSQIVKLRVPQR